MNSSSQEIPQLINEFRKYLSTEEGKRHLTHLKEIEPKETRQILERLNTLPRDSKEFVNLVLYGLLPNGKSKYAIRVSIAPAFLNIKKFFARFNYSEKDWTMLANLVYKLVKSFDENPERLQEFINEFVSNRLSKGLQCGSISPIFFALKQDYPIINAREIRTYKELSPKGLGRSDSLSQKLKDYLTNVRKLKEFAKVMAEKFGFREITDMAYLDLFCYWYDEKGKALPPPSPRMPSHTEIMEMLLELGKIEGYRVEKEFRVNRERLDVVWMRKMRERPDVAFEVQKRGDFYAALVKLKEAWDKWGCISVLVTDERQLENAKRWLGRAFHEMEKDARLVLWSDIKEWYEASKKRKEIKERLRL